MSKFIVTLKVLVEAGNSDTAEGCVSDAYFYGLNDAYGKNENINMRKIGVDSEKFDENN